MAGGKVRPKPTHLAGRSDGRAAMGINFTRHRKILRDNIMGITKPAIRRLARRGGVRRISAPIYEDVRASCRTYLTTTLKDCCAILDHCNRKTITVQDVIWVLKRQGRPIWGFGQQDVTGVRDTSRR